MGEQMINNMIEVDGIGFFVPPHTKRRIDVNAISAAPEMYEALYELVSMYVRMINSGDCGSWDPETDTEVINARAALRKARGET